MIVKRNFDEIQNYLSDASNYKSSSCEALYIPSNTDELQQLIKELNSTKTPFTISGAGTGLCGGRVPINGVIISLEYLNKFQKFNENNKSLNVYSGIFLSDVQKSADEYGCFYPPDPTETNCTIGGTIATNASGAKSFKYGQTRRWINSLEMILPNGELVNIHRGENFAKEGILKLKTESDLFLIPIHSNIQVNVKNTAGYFLNAGMDAIDLFIGSEGTLGIITKAELKLVKNPENIFSFVIFFDSFTSLNLFANNLVNKTRSNNWNINEISPRLIEFFDDKALKFSESQFSINNKFGLWIEQEIYFDEEILLNKWMEYFQVNNIDENDIWFAFDNKERQKIKDFRHSIPLKVNDYISQKNLRKVGTDIAVPLKSFSDLYNFCIERTKENKLEYVSYGHIGDSHLHFNILPKDESELVIAKELYYQFCKKAVELNGTISAEHGIGKIKKDYLPLMFSEEFIKSMYKIKKILDPNLLLNIGNIF